MKTRILKTAARGATWMAMALAIGAAAPAAAELIDTSDALVQKARPQTFGDLSMRKQLCARSGFDGNCRDGLPSVKQDLLPPPGDPEDDLPPADPIVELPPIQELLPPPEAFDDLPPAIVPAAAAVAVPEPSAIGLLLLAAAGLATRRARPRR